MADRAAAQWSLSASDAPVIAFAGASQRHDVCDSDWIERFLRDRLTAEQVAAFENHLEECAACRCKLSACAADEGWWSRARDCLARAADDASLTRSGVIAGTPQYMSPEQARGEPVDQRTDLFSLGSVLYAACTGRSPFRAETSYGVLRRICESEAGSLREANSAVPGWLERLVVRLLAKDPDQRYGSAAEVAALLERCLAHVQQPVLVQIPDELADPAPRLLRSLAVSVGNRGMIAAAILLVIIHLRFFARNDSSRMARRS